MHSRDNEGFDQHIDALTKEYQAQSQNKQPNMKVILENFHREEQKLNLLKKRTRKNNSQIQKNQYAQQLSEDTMKYFGWTTQNMDANEGLEQAKKQRGVEKGVQQWVPAIQGKCKQNDTKKDISAYQYDNKVVQIENNINQVKQKQTIESNSSPYQNLTISEINLNNTMTNLPQIDKVQKLNDQSSLLMHSSQCDQSILQTIYHDKKFMRFYETKYKVTADSLSPFKTSRKDIQPRKFSLDEIDKKKSTKIHKDSQNKSCLSVYQNRTNTFERLFQNNSQSNQEHHQSFFAKRNLSLQNDHQYSQNQIDSKIQIKNQNTNSIEKLSLDNNLPNHQHTQIQRNLTNRSQMDKLNQFSTLSGQNFDQSQLFNETKSNITQLRNQIEKQKTQISRSERAIKKYNQQQDRSYSTLMRKLNVNLKFTGKQNPDFIENKIQQEIVQALDKTDKDAKNDIQYERLNDKLLIKQHFDGKAKLTVKDQLRDLLINKCKRFKQNENVEIRKLKENEYNKQL